MRWPWPWVSLLNVSQCGSIYAALHNLGANMIKSRPAVNNFLHCNINEKGSNRSESPGPNREKARFQVSDGARSLRPNGADFNVLAQLSARRNRPSRAAMVRLLSAVSSLSQSRSVAAYNTAKPFLRIR